jgi:hypothetical protein
MRSNGCTIGVGNPGETPAIPPATLMIYELQPRIGSLLVMYHILCLVLTR